MAYRFNANRENQFELVNAELVEEAGKINFYKIGIAPSGEKKITIKLPESRVCEKMGKIFIPQWLLRIKQKQLGKIFYTKLAN